MHDWGGAPLLEFDYNVKWGRERAYQKQYHRHRRGVGASDRRLTQILKNNLRKTLRKMNQLVAWDCPLDSCCEKVRWSASTNHTVCFRKSICHYRNDTTLKWNKIASYKIILRYYVKRKIFQKTVDLDLKENKSA